MEGNDHVEAAKLTLLMNTAPGQLLSPQNLAGDRDALVTDYLNRGFEQVAVEITQQPENAADAARWMWSSTSPKGRRSLSAMCC